MAKAVCGPSSICKWTDPPPRSGPHAKAAVGPRCKATRCEFSDWMQGTMAATAWCSSTRPVPKCEALPKNLTT